MMHGLLKLRKGEDNLLPQENESVVTRQPEIELMEEKLLLVNGDLGSSSLNSTSPPSHDNKDISIEEAAALEASGKEEEEEEEEEEISKTSRISLPLSPIGRTLRLFSTSSSLSSLASVVQVNEDMKEQVQTNWSTTDTKDAMNQTGEEEKKAPSRMIDIKENSTTSSHRNKLRRPGRTNLTVKFKDVTIHEHNVIIGDNPACSSGCPVSIGWLKLSENKLSLDEYEEWRPPRRDRRHFLLPKDVRHDMLTKEWDCSFSSLYEAIKDVQKEQKHRLKSQRSFECRFMTIFGNLHKSKNKSLCHA